jgi:hypothetical protein
MRFPDVLEWHDEKVAHSYVLPDEALAEVVLPIEPAPAYSSPFHTARRGIGRKRILHSHDASFGESPPARD